MAPATTKGVRKTLLKAISTAAEATEHVPPEFVADFARATVDLTSAYMNIHVIAPEDA
jgi:hypothetical protein